MKMKPYHSFIIFLAFIVSAICASASSYRCTENDIVNDMNRALVITLHDRQDQWLTPDTIQDYRSHLRIDLLRETSTLCYVVDDRRGLKRMSSHNRDRQQLMSDAMTMRSHTIRSYANCSFADVFGMSNQRTPLSLTLMAMLWAAAATIYHRRQNCTAIAPYSEATTNNEESVDLSHYVTLGTLAYSASDDNFFNNAVCSTYGRLQSKKQPVRFTPMQHQLMRMFFNSNNHQLTKAEICSTLWPKKPDASETLYTLIRRVKPIAEAYGLAIEVERGRAYRLAVTEGTASEPCHAAKHDI